MAKNLKKFEVRMCCLHSLKNTLENYWTEAYEADVALIEGLKSFVIQEIEEAKLMYKNG